MLCVLDMPDFLCVCDTLTIFVVFDYRYHASGCSTTWWPRMSVVLRGALHWCSRSTCNNHVRWYGLAVMFPVRSICM